MPNTCKIDEILDYYNNICLKINSKEGRIFLRKKIRNDDLGQIYTDIIVNKKYNKDLGSWSGTSYNEFMGLLYIAKKHENECIVITSVDRRSVRQIDFSMDWDSVSKTLYYPRLLKRNINSCLRNKNIRFILISIGMTSGKYGHANWLIIDKKSKTVERFEPHGYNMRDFEEDKLETVLTYYFKQLGYTYIPYTQTCPAKGIQTLENMAEQLPGVDTNGYCAAWGLFFIDMRLTFPDIPSKILQELMLDSVSSNPEILLVVIRNYASFIKSTFNDILKIPLEEHQNYILNKYYDNDIPIFVDEEGIIDIIKYCGPSKEFFEKTGRCRKKCRTDQYRDPNTGRCRKSKKIKTCNSDQEINPKTGRCRKKCRSDQYRNPKTGRCRKR